MRYSTLASDYDGTLANHGATDESTLHALRRFRASGRTLILVTGRQMPDLLGVFPHTDLFTRIVAENGAVLYGPDGGNERALAPPPPSTLVAALRDMGVEPLSAGKAVIASTSRHESTIADAIRRLGLDYHVVLNKGALMVLPAGVDKASGLAAALDELRIAPQEVAGIGDAENDEAFLRICGLSAAVANALPAVKEQVDIVTEKDHGAGVAELIERLLGEA